MNCEQAETLLAAYVFDEVRLPVLAELRDHLAVCETCSGRVREMQASATRLREALAESDQPALSGERRARLERLGPAQPRSAWWRRTVSISSLLPKPLRPAVGVLTTVLVGVLLAVLLAGMLLPATGRARDEARKVRGSSNLAQIGKAANMWLLKKGDNQYYPPSLESLAKDDIITEPKVFLSPAKGTELRDGEFVSDYESIFDKAGRKLTESEADSSTPMAWDKKGNYSDGRNVVFFDGHVEFYPDEEPFQRLLKKTDERLGTQLAQAERGARAGRAEESLREKKMRLADSEGDDGRMMRSMSRTPAPPPGSPAVAARPSTGGARYHDVTDLAIDTKQFKPNLRAISSSDIGEEHEDMRDIFSEDSSAVSEGRASKRPAPSDWGELASRSGDKWAVASGKAKPRDLDDNSLHANTGGDKIVDLAKSVTAPGTWEETRNLRIPYEKAGPQHPADRDERRKAESAKELREPEKPGAVTVPGHQAQQSQPKGAEQGWQQPGGQHEGDLKTQKDLQDAQDAVVQAQHALEQRNRELRDSTEQLQRLPEPTPPGTPAAPPADQSAYEDGKRLEKAFEDAQRELVQRQTELERLRAAEMARPGEKQMEKAAQALQQKEAQQQDQSAESLNKAGAGKLAEETDRAMERQQAGKDNWLRLPESALHQAQQQQQGERQGQGRQQQAQQGQQQQAQQANQQQANDVGDYARKEAAEEAQKAASEQADRLTDEVELAPLSTLALAQQALLMARQKEDAQATKRRLDALEQETKGRAYQRDLMKAEQRAKRADDGVALPDRSDVREQIEKATESLRKGDKAQAAAQLRDAEYFARVLGMNFDKELADISSGRQMDRQALRQKQTYARKAEDPAALRAMLSQLRQQLVATLAASGLDDPRVKHLCLAIDAVKRGLGEPITGDEVRRAQEVLVPVNPFVLTQSDPLSTFALETDTGSYALTRSYIRRGFLPPARLVRVEEFVNAFDYNYSGTMQNAFSIQAAVSASPFRSGLCQVTVGVKAKRAGRDGRRPNNIVLCIDTSSSMGTPERLPLAQLAATMLVGNLDSADRISIVTYGTQAQLVLDHIRVGGYANKIIEAIHSLPTGGSTNVAAGLAAAYEQAHKTFRSGANNQVLLISDGIATVGPDDARKILRFVELDRRQGITLTCAGVGTGQYNDRLMEQLADNGDGRYIFIDTPEEAQRVFVDEFASLDVVARDAKIQVEFNPEVVRRYRLLGYESRAIADRDFRNDAVDAGEIGSGQSATALYELELVQPAPGQAEAAAGVPGQIRPAERGPVGIVRIRYRDVETGQVQEIASEIQAGRALPSGAAVPARVRLAACAAQFAEILRGSKYAQEGGSLQDIERVLAGVCTELPLDDRAAELFELVRSARGLPRGQ